MTQNEDQLTELHTHIERLIIKYNYVDTYVDEKILVK